MSTDISRTQTDGTEEADSLQDRIVALDVDEEAERLLTDLVADVEEATALAATAQKTANRSMEKANSLRDEVETLREENQELRQQVRNLENRTELLDAASMANQNVVEKRAAVLLQTLYNEAYEKKQKAHLDNVRPRASMDYNAAKAALGGSVQARAQLYDAMRQAVRLVHGDDLEDDELSQSDFIVRFISEGRSATKNTRLQIDLEEADELQLENGQTITPPQGGAR